MALLKDVKFTCGIIEGVLTVTRLDPLNVEFEFHEPGQPDIISRTSRGAVVERYGGMSSNKKWKQSVKISYPDWFAHAIFQYWPGAQCNSLYPVLDPKNSYRFRWSSGSAQSTPGEWEVQLNCLHFKPLNNSCDMGSSDAHTDDVHVACCMLCQA
jgi:hypothetical protein